MKRYRRGPAKALSSALILLFLLQAGMTSPASSPDTQAEDSYVEQEQLPEDGYKKASDSDAPRKKENKKEKTTKNRKKTDRKATASDAPEADKAESPDRPAAGYNDLTASSSNALPEISTLSLLPINEYEVTLDFTNSKLDLKNMPWSEVINKLNNNLSGDEEKPIIEENEKVRLEYFETIGRQSKQTAVDKYIDRNGYIDFTQIESGDESKFFMVLLVGTGSQLDYNARRYKVTVEMPAQAILEEHLTFYLVDASVLNSGNITGEGALLYAESKTEAGIPVTVVNCFLPLKYKSTEEYKLGISSRCYDNDIKVSVYEMNNKFEAAIKNAKNIEEINSFNRIDNILQVDTAEYILHDDKFCLVYTDTDDNIIGYRGLEFVIHHINMDDSAGKPNELSEYVGQFYLYEDGEMKPAISKISGPKNTLNWIIDPGVDNIKNRIAMNYQDIEFAVKEEYNVTGLFYYVKGSNVTNVKTATQNGEDAADNVRDVTEDASNTKEPPFGAPVYFTAGEKRWVELTFDDESVLKFYIKLKEGTSYNNEEYDPAPPVGGGKDKRFNVDGIWNNGYQGNLVDFYSDTYYGYGYQTLIIPKNIELNNLLLAVVKVNSCNVYLNGVEQTLDKDHPPKIFPSNSL